MASNNGTFCTKIRNLTFVLNAERSFNKYFQKVVIVTYTSYKI